MSAIEEIVIKFPVKTKLVCSECGALGEGSCRCGAPYVPPGERAEAYVKAHPEKSNRAIAEEIGISEGTVRTARRKSTAQNYAVEKRIGKDNKKRKMPRPKEDKVRQAIKAKVLAGDPVNRKKLGAEHGVGEHAVQNALAREQGRLEVLDELSIDPETLVPSAKAKLEIAKRMMERKLNAEYAERVRKVDEEVRQRVLVEGKAYVARMEEMEKKAWENEKHWREMVNNHKPIFTKDQYRHILMCLHPDGQRTPDKLAEAFRLFNSKKIPLTGET